MYTIVPVFSSAILTITIKPRFFFLSFKHATIKRRSRKIAKLGSDVLLFARGEEFALNVEI